ncbi:receptor-type tyrosine-protein phosphatase gamma-like [Ciona intestinalis]
MAGLLKFVETINTTTTTTAVATTPLLPIHINSTVVTTASLNTSSTTTTTVNICSTIVCQGSRTCVPDPDFRGGYKCCKIVTCPKNDGRYCPDPGLLPNTTRLPLIRTKKYPFKPTEIVLYQCLPKLKYADSTVRKITCLRNGSWSYNKPRCVEYPILRNPANMPKSPTPTKKPEAPASNSGTVIAVAVIFSVFLVIAVVWFLWTRWKRNQEEQLFQNENIYQNEMDTSYKPVVFNPDNYTADLLNAGIKAEDFPQYVALRHHNNDQGFIEEFEEIQNWPRPCSLRCDASILVENTEKNRYTNIVAYDHTRVLLQVNRNRHRNLHRGADYINANYVSSYTSNRAYIACQGPLPNTFNDFWRMVWENNTSTIIMITNLVEKGRRKCDQYWPQEGREQYKHIVVTLKSTEVFANYTVRSFTLKNNKLSRRNGRGGERRVMQFHYTQWPDHGTPEYLLPVLSFIRKSSTSNPPHAGPIVIHCSAGVGRTGTYIVIHSMMEMLQATGYVNVREFLQQIRLQRNHLVQTEDQYVFVHDAILEHITSGITERSLMQLAMYYQKLTDKQPEVYQNGKGDVGSSMLRSGLEKQFMQVVYSRSDNLDFDFAMRSVNENKNRPGALLPVFRSRALLCNRTSAEGSDYINASFLQSYRSSHGFIITQLPLPTTKKDFWQLIWDHNCSSIVTILDNESTENECYWPNQSRPLHCNSFNVSFGSESLVSDENECHLKCREFILEATKDDYVLAVKQFELSSWSTETPSITQLNALRHIIKLTSSKDGSTVLQDRFGSTAAAQLACWYLIHCQLDNENTVDIYQTAVLACQMRPRVFTSPAHLKFLYEASLLEAKVRCNSSSHEAKRAVSPAQTFSNQMNRNVNNDEIVTEKTELLIEDRSSSRQESAAQSVETKSSDADDVMQIGDDVIAMNDEVFVTNPV